MWHVIFLELEEGQHISIAHVTTVTQPSDVSATLPFWCIREAGATVELQNSGSMSTIVNSEK